MTTFDLRKTKLRSGEQHRTEHEIDLEPLVYGREHYLPVPSTVPAEVTVSRASTGTVLELAFKGRLHGPCHRCLGDAVVDRRITAREYQATNAETDELRSPYVADDRVDLSAWARDALALALPDQILCRPDCAGLCAVCGRNLNDEPHTHEDEAADPRWAALAELRDRL
jgi:uncharacterized protein